MPARARADVPVLYPRRRVFGCSATRTVSFAASDLRRYARGVDVRLTTVPGEAEAEALCGLLGSEGIECAHRQTDEEDSPFEGIGTGGVREILVHETDLERAREIIGAAEA
jgi:hypothetical protein